MSSHTNDRVILALNSGSSSLKFSVFRFGESEQLCMRGDIDGIGRTSSLFTVKGPGLDFSQHAEIGSHDRALDLVIEKLRSSKQFAEPEAVGHRIVHGGARYTRPARIEKDLLAELERLKNVSPTHMPAAILTVSAAMKALPDSVHVACFDTAFHSTIPQVAKCLALPRYLYDEGVMKYGFHGLSYQYILEELEAAYGEKLASSRLIIAHLGNGASMAAVNGGVSIDTTMSFSPAAGLVMGTRCGDLDPGVAYYLLKQKNLSADEFNSLVNKESGLLGISRTSADMRELLDKEQHDESAALAIEIFCYQARKFVGSLAAALGGLDALVFTGGIGENSAEIRRRICSGLEFLGVNIDEQSNAAGGPEICTDGSAVRLLVLDTNEELLIARHSAAFAGDR